MQRYGNHDGHSGVVAYALADDAIAVRFRNGETYVYTADSAGAEVVATMQRLATAGRGLSTYISQTVRDAYAGKIEL
ncbi:hypothetical protein [Xanthomonas vasicola]|uniref:KTSC domain-containing protein n=1 Tax=Xanthomonas vasicola TaxID=56459 RepID=A0ABD7S8W5_XANVA|nr:hypothetical protein [Xanthomonas vasicola]KFA27316.1 hypothetical protein KWS_0118030 [Xanthomonas vasicola pv. musacearum NCPPB 4384]AZR25088.1 hypothetical protein NX81_023055 [Xanthomonas vasicola]AZR33095.1 hypothetical protein KWO_021930 [Xanthomonas vasicola pv. musacearum NCPPB 4379]AZR37127.1 hypothetical protein NX08_022595 [Xanthomonas vasicola]KFA09325.1 hypothetical protein KWM_0111095 [Xanthomonas vasicola pv. musacearum NCPPB 2005]